MIILCSIIQNVVFSFQILQSKNLQNKMDTIQQTLRKARQVDEKFKAFMTRKVQSDKSMQQTMKKIQQTQQTLAQTKQTINQIDSMYGDFEKRFSQAIDAALKGVQKSVLLSIADQDWKPNKITEKDFVKNLKSHKQILFLTGAGMSVASGIPTFRGANGFWDKQNLKNEMFQNVKTPQEILTLSHFRTNQFLTWKWLADFYKIKQNAKPNKGHAGLNSIMTELVNSDRKSMLVTQNIDGFHQLAKDLKNQNKKSQKQYEIHQIHGDINQLRCQNCSEVRKEVQFYVFKDYMKQIQQKQSPKCPKCACMLRPHIMFFDQFYNELYHKVQSVQNFQKQTDLVVVIGTALQTGLSRRIVQNALQKKIPIMEINLECQIKRPNTMWIEGKADQVLDKIKIELWKTGL